MNARRTKTIKTAAFASPIVAMILPFSAVDFAEATSDSREAQELKKRINELESSKRNISDDFELNQYRLALQWFQAEGNPKEQHRIMNEVTAPYPAQEDYTPGRDAASAQEGSYMGPIYYTGSTEKNFNCENQSDDFGNISGSVTMMMVPAGLPEPDTRTGL